MKLRPKAGPKARPKAGRSSGSMRALAANAHCPFIPIDGFLLNESPEDIPPLTTCHVAPSEPGFIRGRRRRRGRAAGAKQTIVARSRDDRTRLFSTVFGHTVTGADLEAVFSGHSRGGTKAEARLMRVYTSGISNPDFLDISAEFEIRIGSHSGKMIRRFYRDKETGKVTAYHETFDLDETTPKELGQGVGESITRSSLVWYVKNGVADIRTYATWVGRYVWATFGFNWASAEVQRDKARQLAGYLEEHEDQFDVTRGATIRGQFKVGGSTTSAIRAVSQGVAKDAWTLASLHLPKAGGSEMDHVGKTFLIGIKDPRDPHHYLRGEEGASDWEGTLVLRPGHPTFERARVRLKL